MEQLLCRRWTLLVSWDEESTGWWACRGPGRKEGRTVHRLVYMAFLSTHISSPFFLAWGPNTVKNWKENNLEPTQEGSFCCANHWDYSSEAEGELEDCWQQRPKKINDMPQGEPLRLRLRRWTTALNLFFIKWDIGTVMLDNSLSASCPVWGMPVLTLSKIQREPSGMYKHMCPELSPGPFRKSLKEILQRAHGMLFPRYQCWWLRFVFYLAECAACNCSVTVKQTSWPKRISPIQNPNRETVRLIQP